MSNKYTNKLYEFSHKEILNNNISSFQNNYYKEYKNLSSHINSRNDSSSIINKDTSNSKNKYKVTYSNSILDNNINPNIYQNIENKNVLVINNQVNNSIGNIKEIKYYNNNNSNKNTYNYTKDNFYTKIANEILNSDDKSNSKNNKNNKNINLSIENNNLNLDNNKTHSIMHTLNNNHINHDKNHKNKSKNIKNIKKNIPLKVPKVIYAKYDDKKTILSLGNNYNNKNEKQNNNKINNKRSLSKKKEGNEKSSKNPNKKFSFVKNSKSNKKNKNINNLNYYSNITYSNGNNLNSNKKVEEFIKNKIISNKNNNSNKNQIKEIKKAQSEAHFNYNHNQDLNKNNKIYNTNTNYSKSKSKSKNKNDMSYKGIIINKKNMIKNHIIKSSSQHNSSKKNRIVCINYNNKTSAKKNNKINNYNNYIYFMNNIPEEYNKDQLFLQIKKLWNKLNVSYTYQEMFITLTKQNEKKKYIFENEINNLSLIINYLTKLNEDIKKRDDIINKIKSFNNYNNLEDIKKLLESLRMISIDVVLDYIIFLKEISYNIITKKINLDDIKDFNKNYLNIMKNDTNFLYYHNYLNKIFHFSKTSDPFLVYPSLKNQNNNNDNKNKYIILSLDKNTLEKINKCEYFLLTEKIGQYSTCKSKANINYLLFNDQDNIINNIINRETINDTINKSMNNIDNNNNKENNSPFRTPINKNSNINKVKTTNHTNKYEKFCYINNTSNSTNDNNKENNKNKEEENIVNEINIKNNKSSIESDKNNSIINNSNDIYSSPIPVKIKKNNYDIDNNNLFINNNIEITPYISTNESPLSTIYSSYLTLVPENIKKSFNINEDIFYYSNIGIYPKILLFKDNKTFKIKGICTISYGQNINISKILNKKILVVTSISCIQGEKISNILLNLIEFCKKEEIIYDSLEVILYYIKKEDGNFILDEELENEIKSEAKFKWVTLENDGEKRKIKYHYIPNNIITDKEKSILNDIDNNNNSNSDMNCNKYAIYINNYVLIKYYQMQGINDISTKYYGILFFTINLINKYFLLEENNNNTEEDKENILINLKGIKLQRIINILSEYNNVLLTNDSEFKNQYIYDDNYNIELLNSFLELIEKSNSDNKRENKNNVDKNICLNFNNIINTFSNIIKIDIDGYEYNIISMNDFIIEVFNISNNDDNNKENIYFTKSEKENISFIFYELNDNINNNNENYIKMLFNKVLKKILIKDSEEPIKSYKKICIPSFSYQKKIINENKENNKINLIEYDMLDCNESFDFCIENIPNYNTKYSFAFNKNNFENDEIKIIKNNFVVAVLNPDLVLDYHLPAMNIYYINKECWIKANKK